jgi:hypothetical protein
MSIVGNGAALFGLCSVAAQRTPWLINDPFWQFSLIMLAPIFWKVAGINVLMFYS